MAQTINTNIASLTAQRNLNNSANALNTSLERLSSGLRINSAKDDAAGLAISERFTSQIRGLDQAARNANDGISLAQTAEGALSEITNNLQRIRELSVQSANATNSSSDRAALQAEVSELLEEIDRVASETSFNGVSLLNGSFDSQVFQVGANAGQTIGIDEINSARTATLGEVVEAAITGGAIAGAGVADGDLIVNGNAVAASDTAAELGAAIEAADSNITATVNDAVFTSAAIDAGGGGATETRSFTIANSDGSLTADISVDVLVADSAADAAAAIVAQVDGAFTGLSAQVVNTDEVEITLAGGDNIVISAATNTNVADGTTRGTVDLTSAEDLVFTGANATNAGSGFVDTVAAGSGVFLDSLSIATVDGATSALRSVDAALTSINSSRAELGAIQNRFESVVRSLQTTSENLSASRSRILDADFAAETASLTKGQILQQAGTTVLAQANALPQNVLSLLG